ncbi:MAG: sulfate permease [Anaerolineales bacterium]|jgi:high affinity sulfate transporter 1|nr:sulfate permease [Anaerolineales bacterium]
MAELGNNPPSTPGRITRSARLPDQRGIWNWLPGLYTLRHYQKPWLRLDIQAGLALTAVLVPVGMAYAQAAGLPAIYGLYATIFPLLAYAIFGPSRILVLGPDSSLAPMIAAAILPLAVGDASRAVMLAGLIAILSGAFGVLAGLLHLGFITDLLSKPIRYGYMNGIALTVFVSQLPKLFGFSVPGENVVDRTLGFIQGIALGKTNLAALLLGSATLAGIFLLKRCKQLPGVLIAVGGATLLVSLFNLEANHGIAVLGRLPQGLPVFTLPKFDLAEIQSLLPAAVAIAVVSFADTSVLSRVYAAKTNTHVNPNQEMIGLGLANITAGLFQGFPISSSTSRTPVAEAAGARTQLSGVVGALAIALLLILAPGLLSDLPSTALAAVVIASAWGLIETNDLRRLYRIQRWEFWLSIATFLGVALLGPIPGMMLAIGIALAEFIWDAWRPYYAVLGRAHRVKGYHDITRYPHARRIPGLVLFRWDAPLFFANAALFQQVVLDAIAESPTPVRWLVVAAEPVTSIDITSVDMLTELDLILQKAGIELVFAEMKDPVKDKLKRFGVFTTFGEHLFFHTLGEAVHAYLATFQVEWVDWEDGEAWD